MKAEPDRSPTPPGRGQRRKKSRFWSPASGMRSNGGRRDWLDQPEREPQFEFAETPAGSISILGKEK